MAGGPPEIVLYCAPPCSATHLAAFPWLPVPAKVEGGAARRNRGIRVRFRQEILQYLRIKMELREETASDRSVPFAHRGQGREQPAPSPSNGDDSRCPISVFGTTQALSVQRSDHVIANYTATVSPEEKRNQLRAKLQMEQVHPFCNIPQVSHPSSLQSLFTSAPDGCKRYPVPCERCRVCLAEAAAKLPNASAVTSASTSDGGLVPVFLLAAGAWGLG